MARYIDADKLKEDLMCVCTVGGLWGEAQEKYIEVFQSIIDRQPTANVRKNIQGEWIKHGKEVECNKCGAIFTGGKHELLGAWKFCPNCGADMRKERED